MEPYLVNSRNGNKDLPEIDIVPWTASMFIIIVVPFIQLLNIH